MYVYFDVYLPKQIVSETWVSIKACLIIKTIITGKPSSHYFATESLMSALFSPLWQIFMDNQNLFTVKTNNAAQLVESAARNIESFLKKRAAALEVR